jgi:ankyrin repeat protein
MMSFDDTLQDAKGRGLEHFAAAGGDLRVIRELEGLRHRFAAGDELGNTPLHYACQMGKLDVVHWLWTKGVDVRATNVDGESPLYIACLMGHLDIARFLIQEAEVPPSTPPDALALVIGAPPGRCQPIHGACEGGHADILRYLIGLGCPLNELNPDSQSPLSIAVISGALACVQILCRQKGTNFDKKRRKFSPLVDAAAYGHLDVVKFLIDSGADILLPNSQGLTPLACAITNCHLRVAEFLIDRGALGNGEQLGDLIFAACGANNLELVKLLVERGNVDCTTHLGVREWLSQGVELESKSVIEYFLARGAVLKSCSLESTIKRKNCEFLDYLLNQGADLNEDDPTREPPIITAVKSCRMSQVQWFLSHGAALTGEMITRHLDVLEVAIEANSPTFIDFILAYHPDLSKNPFLLRKTLLSYFQGQFRPVLPTLRRFCYETTEKLLRAGAVFLTDDKGCMGKLDGVYGTELNIATNYVAMDFLRLYKHYRANFRTLEYSLRDIHYDVGEEKIIELFRFLDENGARQRNEAADSAVAKALQKTESDTLLDFMLARIGPKDMKDVSFRRGTSALSIAERLDRVDWAIKLLRFGATICNQSFTTWAKNSGNETLRKLAEEKIGEQNPFPAFTVFGRWPRLFPLPVRSSSSNDMRPNVDDKI